MVRLIPLFFCIGIACSSAGTPNHAITVAGNSNKMSEKSPPGYSLCDINGGNLSSRVGKFYSKVPDDFRDVASDSQFLQEVRNCSKPEMTAALEQLRASRPKDFAISVKTTYLMVKIGHEVTRNKEDLLNFYAKYPFSDIDQTSMEPDRVMDMLADILLRDDAEGELLSDALDLQASGAVATTLFSAFAEVIKEDPNKFLLTLKTKPHSRRLKIYESLCVISSPSELAPSLEGISRSSEAYVTSQEMLKAFLGRACRST